MQSSPQPTISMDTNLTRAHKKRRAGVSTFPWPISSLGTPFDHTTEKANGQSIDGTSEVLLPRCWEVPSSLSLCLPKDESNVEAGLFRSHQKVRRTACSRSSVSVTRNKKLAFSSVLAGDGRIHTTLEPWISNGETKRYSDEAVRDNRTAGCKDAPMYGSVIANSTEQELMSREPSIASPVPAKMESVAPKEYLEEEKPSHKGMLLSRRYSDPTNPTKATYESTFFNNQDAFPNCEEHYAPPPQMNRQRRQSRRRNSIVIIKK